MEKSIPALVTPEVLVWARELDAISVDEIASKMKIPPQKIEEWEDGISYPTLTQAKELARQYRVPFVYFYLPDTPQKKKRLSKVDYRAFGNMGVQSTESRELRWLLRDIEDRRDSMLDLYEEIGKKTLDFPIKVDVKSSNEEIAKVIRELLNLSMTTQKKFRYPEKALSHCVEALEKKDVLVFQAAKIETSEMRGLSVAYEQMPIIVLNRKDEPSARLFTLCHELVHIVTRTSGICTDVSENSTSNNELELRCNQIAGMVLVPKSSIAKHPIIKEIQIYGFDDGRVGKIAKDFAVSKQVILHCLWELNIISQPFYYETLNRYSDEYKAYKAQKPKKGFLPPVTDTVSQVGKLYARTVLNAYYAEKITARDTSSYLLNLKAKNFGKLERWCF